MVIDGALAFCGGIDLSVGRWDLRAHRPDEPHRRSPRGAELRPFHDCMLMVEGETARGARGAGARALAARDRRAGRAGAGAAAVGLAGRRSSPGSRTRRWRSRAPGRASAASAQAREVEALFLDAIGAARECIYIENQYLTVPAIAEALAERLREPDGPEIVIVSPDLCEGFVETRVMDRGRDQFCKLLRGVGRDDRLRIMYPVHETEGGARASINVHAKLMIVDDRLLIVGSANLAKRSMGLDTECDLAVAAEDDADRRAIARARHELLAEHLGCSPASLVEEAARAGLADRRPRRPERRRRGASRRW